MTDAHSSGGLPLKPPRNNYAYDCEREPGDDLPDHLDGCACDEHVGVCQVCNYKITIGTDGTEYGHARATNRGSDDDGVRRDCPNRPLACNPGEPHAWEGYGEQAVADGGDVQEGEADA